MTTFLVIGLIGLAVLLVSLIVGDVADGALDALSGDVFSTAVIGAFVSAAGFAAATADALGAPLGWSLAVGGGAGAVFAWFAAWLTRVLRRDTGEATPSTHDAVGRDAVVLTDIPDGGFGVVRVVIGGHTVQLNARAERDIAAGTPVHVTEALSPTAVAVAPTWPELS